MPITTGVSPSIVQTKSEPDPVLVPKTTIKTPKAINPIEIRYEAKVSMYHVSKRSERSNGCVAFPKHALKPREQFGFLIEGRRDKYPRHNDRNDSKRVDFGVVPEA